MVHAEELDDENNFYCPLCDSPLSLLKRVHSITNELAILVTCEFCDEYHGFVISTNLQEEDLNKFNNYRKRPLRAKIEGYDWNEEDN